MIKLPFKKTYRVLEAVEKGERKFFPQQRVMYFFWKKLIQEDCMFLEEEFLTLERANECLYKRHLNDINNKKDDIEMRKKMKNDHTVTHPFDAVFYKLKK